MEMELILGICVGALSVLCIMLGMIVIILVKTVRSSLTEERNTAKSFIRYTHPGAFFEAENRPDKKHKSLSQRQAEAMESRGEDE